MSIEQEIAALEAELSLDSYKSLVALQKKILLLSRRCELLNNSFEERFEEEFDKRAQEFVSAEPENFIYEIVMPENVTYLVNNYLYDWCNDGHLKETPICFRSLEDAKLYLTQLNPNILKHLDSLHIFATFTKQIRVKDCLQKYLVNMLRWEAGVPLKKSKIEESETFF